MTKEQYPQHTKAVDLNNIPENFVITYYANKHKKIITRNGQWTKPDDFKNYMRSIGKLGGQNKVPRLSNDRKIVEQLTLY